jgi:DNA-binding CsgD family transcriptional regulator
MLATAQDRDGSRAVGRERHDSVASAARQMNGDRGRVAPFLRAFHASQIPMVVVDNHRRYLDANRAAKLLSRMSLGEFRRRRIEQLTPRTQLPRMERLWDQLLRQGQVAGDYEVQFDDGSSLEIVFSALANVLPGQHLIVFAPAGWPPDELGALEERPRPVPVGRLSSREREVLTLIAAGHPLPEIAERLTISLATVRTHAANVYRKLGARNRPHAVALALRRDLIDPPHGPAGELTDDG